MKRIIFSFLMLFSVMFASAQTAVESQKVFDNVYVGGGVQVSTPLDFYDVFPLNTSFNVYVGKDFTPVFGVNLEGDLWIASHTSKGAQMRFDRPNVHNFFRQSYVGLNTLVNFSNLFGGYKGTPRPFEMQSVVGLGWLHTFRANMSDRMHDDLGAKTGLNLNFNLGARKAHTLYVQPAVLWNLTSPASHHDHIAFNKNRAQVALSVGYIYHFKTSNGTHTFKTYDIGAMTDEINALRKQLADRPGVVVKEVVKEVEKTQVVADNVVIFFAQNSAELTSEAKDVLDKVKGTVDIVASASPEGTKDYNQVLSNRRAEVVANYLRDRNVTVNNVTGVGVTGDTSGRVAIIKVTEK